MAPHSLREKLAPALLLGSGVVVMGIGLYFIFIRPALLAGLSSVGLMSAVNFVIDSEYKWFLFALALLWGAALLVHCFDNSTWKGHR